MRAAPGTYRLTFIVPRELVPRLPRGRHQPCVEGCVLTIEGDCLASIEGPSRERVFEQTQRLLRILCKGSGPRAIAATLERPLRDHFGRPIPGRESWSIVVNASIAFTPGRAPVHMPRVNGRERFG